jgi:hypothetical protein
MAEGVGFEPTEASTSLVFKTSAIGHSATPPGRDDKTPTAPIGATELQYPFRASPADRRIGLTPEDDHPSRIGVTAVLRLE